MKPTLVFDIDDTISIHENRDYVNAKPIYEVINKINKLHQEGYYIKLYSSRGQVSCNGDLKLIKEKNESILIEWLKKHNVEYDELIFGKPIGDLYIDDKAMNVEDFINSEFETFKTGHSGKQVIRMGNFVKKEMSSEQVQRLKKWYENKPGDVYSPKIYSYLYDAVYMKYINGILLSNTSFNIFYLINIIDKFNLMKNNKGFNYQNHIDILNKNKCEELNNFIDFVIKRLKQIEIKSTFCHGDFILSNIIKTYDGDFYFLDSQYDEEASSYLLDFAKLRMSLDGYETYFNNSRMDFKKYLKELDCYLMVDKIYEKVLILQLMYTIRLYRYNKDKVSIIKNMCEKIMEELSNYDAKER